MVARLNARVVVVVVFVWLCYVLNSICALFDILVMCSHANPHLLLKKTLAAVVFTITNNSR